MSATQAQPGDAATESVPTAETARELRRAKRMETRRREILGVAEELFAAHGYDGTSLEKIANGTGYSVGGIYTFFPSKDAVYTAVLDLHATMLAERLVACAGTADTGLDQLIAMAAAAIRHLREFPDQARVSVGSLTTRQAPSEGRGTTRAILDAYALAIREGQSDGTVRGGDPLSLAQYVGGLVFAHMHVDPQIAGHPPGIELDDFLSIVRGALGAHAAR